LSGSTADDDLNEFNELLASADNAAFDMVAAATNDDDAANHELTMDLTTAVGAVVRDNAAPIDNDDDQSMQLTAVVASAKPSLFAMVEKLRDDALYDAETDSESDNTAALVNATVPVGDDHDNQTRDMDETAAVGETRIVVKLQPTMLSAEGVPASADATMDMTAVVGRGIVDRERDDDGDDESTVNENDVRGDATMDLTAVVPQRMRASETPVRSNGLAALLLQQRDDGDTTRAFGGGEDDATGNVPPSLGELLKLYQRTDSTQRLSLCAELCDAVGVDARECDRDMMQVMENLGDAETDVVAVGDETAALMNTGRFGNTTRVGALAAGDVTSGFTTILGRLRELREHYDGVTQDITANNTTNIVPVGAATLALADATFDDVVIRGGGASVPPTPTADVAVTTTVTATVTAVVDTSVLMRVDDDDELMSAQEDLTAQSIGSTFAEEAVVEETKEEVVVEEEEPVEEEPTEEIVNESAALMQLKALAVEHGWRLVMAPGLSQYSLVRSAGVFRVTVGASVADSDAAEMGSVAVRAVGAADGDAKLLCDALQWRMATSLTGRDFGSRFVHVCEAIRATELLFDDVRAARRRFNVSVASADRETVHIALRLSNTAVRQQWRVTMTVKNVCAYPRTGVTASADVLIGELANNKAAALAKLAKSSSKKAMRLDDLIAQSNQLLW
jgi:hypothetical protein